MPFTEKNLIEDNRFINRVRFPNGDGINLMNLQDALQDECDANGIPVAFRNDTLKTGGLLSKQVEDVLVLYNPQHEKDYLHFLIRITHQGRYAFMDVFKVHGSKNYVRDNIAGGGNTAVKLFNAVTGHNKKIEEENNYYTILADCMENVIS